MKKQQDEQTTKQRSRLLFPRFPGPGRYRVKFYYRNDPNRRIKGIALGRHHPAIQRVKKSYPAFLKSNELVFTVTP